MVDPLNESLNGSCIKERVDFAETFSLHGFCCLSIHFIVAVSLSANVMKLSRKWYFSFVLTLIYRGKWKYIALNEVKIVLITDDVRFLFAPRWSVKALVLLLLGCICNWLEPSRQWVDVHHAPLLFLQSSFQGLGTSQSLSPFLRPAPYWLGSSVLK